MVPEPCAGSPAEQPTEPLPEPGGCLPQREPGDSDPSLFTRRQFTSRPPLSPSSGRGSSPRWPTADRWRLLATLAAVTLTAALTVGCGPSTQTTDGPAAPLAASGDRRSLAGVCPATVVVQASWFPESTQGGLFQALGASYTVDAKRKRVRGPLVADGWDTGVDLEIRAGGPALSSTSPPPVSAVMRTNPEIMLGQQATEEQVLGWAVGQPTVAVLAPLQVDPLVFIWDKGRHPDWNTLVDIGQTDETVYTFPSANADYMVGTGVFRASQLNYSYDGSPSYHLADPDSAVGGFATNEPFIYRSMGRNIDYAYLAETGIPNYRNSLTVRADHLDRHRPCLTRLVPILQQAMVDFMTRPTPVLELIVKLNTAYKSSYPYPMAQAVAGQQVMRDDGLVANTPGRDGYLGGFDTTRLQKIIDILRPIYAGRASPQIVPAELTARTIAAPEYLDPGIRLPIG